MDLRLLLLPSGAVLVVWPDGRAVRIEPDGSTYPPLAVALSGSVSV